MVYVQVGTQRLSSVVNIFSISCILCVKDARLHFAYLLFIAFCKYTNIYLENKSIGLL
jgi:hypothetical protein